MGTGKFGWCLTSDCKNCIGTAPSGLACTCSCHGGQVVTATKVTRRRRRAS